MASVNNKKRERPQPVPQPEPASGPAEGDEALDVYQPALKRRKTVTAKAKPLDQEAQQLVLEELQKGLNTTDESKLQKALKLFQLRMELDSPTDPNSLLTGYIASSPHCQELMTIWDLMFQQDRAKTFSSAQLLETLASLIKQSTQPNVPLLNWRTSIELSRKIIRQRLKTLVSNLGSDFTVLVNSTLKLLTALVLSGAMHARELFNNFNFAFKPLSRLPDKKQKHSTPGKQRPNFELDVRTNFVRFALAFLKINDDTLKEEVMAVKGFLGGIFKSLPSDPAVLIGEIVTGLFQGIASNSNISKKAKSLFFNSYVLDQVLAAFTRLTLHAENPDPKITQTMYDLLAALCSSYTTGILYKESASSNSTATVASVSSGRDGAANAGPASGQFYSHKNPMVMRVLRELKPAEDPLHEKLVLTIINACSPLKREYFEWVKVNIDPKPDIKWFQSIAFLQKLMTGTERLDKTFFEALFNSPALSASQAADKAAHWIIPATVSRQAVTQCLNSGNKLILVASVTLVESMLRAIAAAKDNLRASPFLSDVVYALKRRLPDLQSFQVLLKKASSNDAPAAAAVESDSMAVDEDAAALLERSSALHLHTLKAMGLSLQIFPETFIEARFDFAKLVTAQAFTLSPGVQLELTALLSTALPWLSWDLMLPDKSTLIGNLLRWLSSTSALPVRSALTHLANQLLLKSGYFDGTEHEIGLWISKITYRSVPYFESLLTITGEDSFKYAELLQQFVATEHISNGVPPVSIVFVCAAATLHQELSPGLSQKVAPYAYDAFDAAIFLRRFAVQNLYMQLSAPKHYLATLAHFARVTEPAPSTLKKCLEFILLALPTSAMAVESSSSKSIANLDANTWQSLPEPERLDEALKQLIFNYAQPNPFLFELPELIDQFHTDDKFCEALRVYLSICSGSALDSSKLAKEIQASTSGEASPNVQLLKSLSLSEWLQLLFTAAPKAQPTLVASPAIVGILTQAIKSNPSLESIRSCLSHIAFLQSDTISVTDTTNKLNLCFALLEAALEQLSDELMEELFGHLVLHDNFLLDNPTELSTATSYGTLRLMSKLVSTHAAPEALLNVDLLTKAVAKCEAILNRDLAGTPSNSRRSSDDQFISMLGALEKVMQPEIRQRLTSSLLKYFASSGAKVSPAWSGLVLDLLQGPALTTLTQTTYWSPYAALVKLGDFSDASPKESASLQRWASLPKEDFSYLLQLLPTPLPSIEWKHRLETIFCGLLVSESTAHGQPLPLASPESLFELCDSNFVSRWLGSKASTPVSKSGAIAAAILVSHSRANPTFVATFLRTFIPLNKGNMDLVIPVVIAACGPREAIRFDSWLTVGGEIPQSDPDSETNKLLSPVITDLLAFLAASAPKFWLPALQALRSLLAGGFFGLGSDIDWTVLKQLLGLVLDAPSPAEAKAKAPAFSTAHFLLAEELIRFLVSPSAASSLQTKAFGRYIDSFVAQLGTALGSPKTKPKALAALRRIGRLAEVGLDVPKAVRAILRRTFESDVEGFKFIAQLCASSKVSVQVISEVHDLLVSHSSFLSKLFGETSAAPDSDAGDDLDPTTQQGQNAGLESKAWLLRALAAIYTAAPSIALASTRLIKIYLAAYNASLTDDNLVLLSILQLFEKQGVSLVKEGGFLWGPLAQDRLKDRRAAASQEEERLQELDLVRVMFYEGKLIQLKRTQATLKNFAITRKLDASISDNDTSPRTIVPSLLGPKVADELAIRRKDQVYDVAFVLPYIASVVQNTGAIDCKKFLDCGALPLVLMAFASHDEQARKYAYSITASYLAALKGSDFREQNQVAWLLQSVQSCIVSPIKRLPTMTASFIAHASLVLSRADHHLFISITEFLTSRALPFESETNIPMWTQLFSSHPTHQGRDREWLLRVILSGLRSTEDLSILQKRQYLSVLCLHSTSRLVASDRERDVIWRILDRSIWADEASHRLTLEQGLISWIGELLSNNDCSPIVLRHACIVMNSILALPAVEYLKLSQPLATQVELFCSSAINAIDRLGPLVEETDQVLALNTVAKAMRVFVGQHGGAISPLLRLIQLFQECNGRNSLAAGLSPAREDLFLLFTSPVVSKLTAQSLQVAQWLARTCPLVLAKLARSTGAHIETTLKAVQSSILSTTQAPASSEVAKAQGQTLSSQLNNCILALHHSQ